MFDIIGTTQQYAKLHVLLYVLFLLNYYACLAKLFFHRALYCQFKFVTISFLKKYIHHFLKIRINL